MAEGNTWAVPGRKPEQPFNAPVDIGIVIPLKEEFEELHRVIGDACLPDKHEKTGAWDYLFNWPGATGNYCCVATFVGDMGEGEMGIRTERLADKWDPKTIIVLGIAAGISGDVQVGDVVVGSLIDSYLQNAKAVQKGKTGYDFELSGESWRPSLGLVSEIQHFSFVHRDSYQEWQSSVRARLEEELAADTIAELGKKSLVRERPVVEVGHVASGPIVAASKSFLQFVKDRDRKYLALEMESGGALAAICKSADPARSVVIRGVSDFGDDRKAEFDQVGAGSLRRYAVQNALGFLWQLLSCEILPKEPLPTDPPEASTPEGPDEENSISLEEIYAALIRELENLLNQHRKTLGELVRNQVGELIREVDGRLALSEEVVPEGFDVTKLLRPIADGLERDEFKSLRLSEVDALRNLISGFTLLGVHPKWIQESMGALAKGVVDMPGSDRRVFYRPEHVGDILPVAAAALDGSFFRLEELFRDPAIQPPQGDRIIPYEREVAAGTTEEDRLHEVRLDFIVAVQRIEPTEAERDNPDWVEEKFEQILEQMEVARNDEKLPYVASLDNAKNPEFLAEVLKSRLQMQDLLLLKTSGRKGKVLARPAVVYQILYRIFQSIKDLERNA